MLRKIAILYLSAFMLLVAGNAISDTTVYVNDKAKSKMELEHFFLTLKKAILDNDKEKVATMTLLPNTLYVDGKKTQVNSKEEFVDNYDKIINSRIKASIDCMQKEKLIYDWRGAMVGAGDIWISSLKFDGQVKSELFIRTINNNPWYKGVKRADDPCFSEKYQFYESSIVNQTK